jgi:hypothetical protein
MPPMNPFQKPLSVISGMSLVNKMLVIFCCLLFFILVVEQPGSSISKRAKGAKLLFPKLLVSEAVKIQFQNLPGATQSVVLNKEEGQWKVVNGQSFPADRERVDHFLSMLENMVGEQTASNNPDRLLVFGLDEKVSPHAQIWGSRGRLVADLYIGKRDFEGKSYIKKAGIGEAILVSQDLTSFLFQDLSLWKDKTLLSLDESTARRVVLAKGSEESILEKKDNQWRMVSPEDREADPLAVRTLFDQLKDFHADRIAESLEGSQANFDKPDYKLTVRLADDSFKVLVFSAFKDHSAYYAKNGDKNLIYIVSVSQVENLFGLKFRTATPTN